MNRMIETTRYDPQPCPACGKMLDAADGPGTPTEGSLSVCAGCGKVAQFDAALKLVPMSDLEFAALPAETKWQVMMAQAIIMAKKGSGPPAGYQAQIEQMMVKAKAWRAANPNREALVQFNFSKGVFVTAAISDAVERKFVTVNAAGLELVKSLWPWGDSHEPTLFMVRLALEGDGE